MVPESGILIIDICYRSNAVNSCLLFRKFGNFCRTAVNQKTNTFWRLWTKENHKIGVFVRELPFMDNIQRMIFTVCSMNLPISPKGRNEIHSEKQSSHESHELNSFSSSSSLNPNSVNIASIENVVHPQRNASAETISNLAEEKKLLSVKGGRRELLMLKNCRQLASDASILMKMCSLSVSSRKH